MKELFFGIHGTKLFNVTIAVKLFQIQHLCLGEKMSKGRLVLTCAKCGLPNPNHKMFFGGWLCEDCFELWMKVYGKILLPYGEALKIWEKFKNQKKCFVFR